MKDLSLHILDIAQNSVSARANKIMISIEENIPGDTFTIKITDDGTGIDPEKLPYVTDPFYTSRTTRKVGLGLPLFKQNAEMCGGSLSISSQVSQGTVVEAVFGHKHLDRPPIGDMAGVFMILAASNPHIRFVYSHSINGRSYHIDTDEVKEILEDIPINDPLVIKQLKEMINENLDELKAGGN